MYLDPHDVKGCLFIINIFIQIVNQVLKYFEHL